MDGQLTQSSLMAAAQGSSDAAASARQPRRSATTRNPVASRLSPASEPAWVEAVILQVEAACERFHRLVGRGLGRRYQRPPVYLVDDWVVDVLGAFVAGGHGQGPDDRPWGPRPEEEDPWLKALMALFGSLQPITTALSRAWLLDLTDDAGCLEQRAVALAIATVQGQGVAEALVELRATLSTAADVPVLATRMLAEEPVVARRLAPAVTWGLERDVARAVDFAEHLATLRPLRPIHQVGVQPGHPGGLLGQGLAALGIEAPAVVLAPNRIWDWAYELAQEVPDLWDGSPERPATPTLWRQPLQLPRAARIALTSVVAHELTHVMLRLPREGGRKVNSPSLDRARDALYRAMPEVEEGAANFLGALAALQEAGELLGSRAARQVWGPSGRLGRGGDWQALWESHREVAVATIGDYHREASLAWLRGWEGTSFELQGMASPFGLLAVNPDATDWRRTMAELAQGRVSVAHD